MSFISNLFGTNKTSALLNDDDQMAVDMVNWGGNGDMKHAIPDEDRSVMNRRAAMSAMYNQKASL